MVRAIITLSRIGFLPKKTKKNHRGASGIILREKSLTPTSEMILQQSIYQNKTKVYSRFDILLVSTWRSSGVTTQIAESFILKRPIIYKENDTSDQKSDE